MLRLRALRAESGNALMLAVFMLAALGLLSFTLIDAVKGDSTRSAQGVTRDAAFQAAEAGIDDYTSKLVVDNQYFLHDVAAGESTRWTSSSCSGGQQVSSSSSAPTAWSYGTTWTYCNGKNNWRQLSNGYEYNLEISGTSSTQQYVDIVATGRKQGTTAPVRVLEERIHPSSVADFQMIADADISYGSGAVTRGKVYVGIDSGGRAHSVTYQSGSKAYADVYAENQVNMSGTLVNPAKAYDSDSNPTIRSVIKTPISFTSFASSISTIQQAASTDSPAMSFDDGTKDAWRLVFNSDGTFSISSCVESYTTDSRGRKTYYAVDQREPTCGGATTYTVPSKGAIYTAQTAIVSGTVNGRVTVASNGDVVVAGNITYVTSGDDVLGLIAKDNVLVAAWEPDCPMSWRAATIAQTGQWKGAASSTTCSYGNGTTTFAMTFTGSTATAGGGSMTPQFSSRQYNYDDTLSYLQPPWFPSVDYPYTVQLFRELPPS